MYFLTILSALICLQLVTIVSSESNHISSNQQLNNLIQAETPVDNENYLDSNSESDEENDYATRSTSFLRFGRSMSPSTGSFLRFGRSMSPSTGSFLRFGRQMSPSSGAFLRFGRQMSPSSGSFLRFGRPNTNFLRFGRSSHSGAGFLRFGRRAQQITPSNFHRFARKGEFLRFG